MPKEQIRFGQTWVVTPLPDGSSTGRPHYGEVLHPDQWLQSDPDVVLGWGSKGSEMAQVSIQFERRQWEACIVEQADQKGGVPEPTDKFGIYVDLDKADIDRMIRSLKNIRKTAFK